MGVSLHFKTYPMFVFKVATVKVHRHHVIDISDLVSFTFSTIPICPFLIQRIFSFTCLLSFFTCFQQIACIFSLALLSHVVWRCNCGDYDIGLGLYCMTWHQ